jgi:rhamnosyltransferase
MTSCGDATANLKVCAVVVSFFPDIAILRRLMIATVPQVEAVVVVDNGTSDSAFDTFCSQPESEKVAIIRQPCNVGLAAAFNIGIEWARKRSFSHVLLLDQDSEPKEGMVENLAMALSVRSCGRRIAAAGPRFHDTQEDRYAPFVRIGFPFNRRIYCTGKTGLVDCDFLISSGVLIPLSVLDDVGGMDEGLFIDNVDLEWSFRARSRGYSLVGVEAASMNHRLGQSRCRMPFFPEPIVVHHPIRLYYIMRNRLLLYRLSHVPAVWIAQDIPRIAMKFLLFFLLIRPRFQNLLFMLKGLRDGLFGRRGPLADSESLRRCQIRR